MTYDPVDTNNDGIVDADVDNQSVSTDSIDNNGSPIGLGDSLDLADAADGTAICVWESVVGDSVIARVIQTTTGVSTSDTVILDGNATLSVSNAQIIDAVVQGNQQGSPSTRFSDEVKTIRAGGEVQDTTLASGGPDTRSYDRQAGADLLLAMSANTYDVVVDATVLTAIDF